LAVIPMLVSKRAKRLGDMAAGTIVLLDRVPARVDVPVAMPPPLAGWAATLDLSRIDEAMATQIRQYLSRAGELNPATRAGMEQHLLTEVTTRLGTLPPSAPGWAILSAVLAERRNRAFAAMPNAGSPYGAAPPYPPPPPPAGPAEPPSTGFAPPG
jgi:hypothetical protein